MFPKVRWLAAAMLTSILVLSGGFALFAALRLTHEPLTHLPPGAGPLQSLAATAETPARTPNVMAAFQSRFPADSRPVVEVAANLNALRLDRGETSTPLDPPAAQDVVTATAALEAQPAAPPDSATPLDAAAEKAAATVPDTAATVLAATEVATPDAASAIAPATFVPEPAAANSHRSTKSRSARPVAKRAAPVRQRVAAKPHRARRFRARSDPAIATAQSAFPGSPFESKPFQDPFQPVQTTRTQRRAGTGAGMGGPFVSPTGIDPY